jgi:hypothetical protein
LLSFSGLADFYTVEIWLERGLPMEEAWVISDVSIVTRDQVSHAKPDPDLFLAPLNAWK